MNIFDYLDRAIATFNRDPPANDYQRGHLDALKVARAELAAMAEMAAPPSRAGRGGEGQGRPHEG